MENNNSSWGTAVEKQKKQSNTATPSSNTWGAVRNSYNEGYSTVLKVFVFIGSFIMPLLVWLAIAGVLVGLTEDGSGFVVAAIGYPITAFVCWVMNSYCAKLFENISRMTQNTEAILYKLTETQKGGKNE